MVYGYKRRVGFLHYDTTQMFVFIILFFGALKIVTYFGLLRNQPEPPQPISKGKLKSKHGPPSKHAQPTKRITTQPRPVKIREPDPSCQDVDFVLIVWNIEEMRDCSSLIKTLLLHRTRPLHLHFLVNNITAIIVEKLMDTTELIDVRYSNYVQNFSVKDENSWQMMKFTVLQLLPETIRKVLYLSNHVRLLRNPERIFYDLTHDSRYRGAALTKDVTCDPTKVTDNDRENERNEIDCFNPRLMVFDRRKLSMKINADLRFIIEANETDVRDGIWSIVDDLDLIDYSWHVHITNDLNSDDRLNTTNIKAVIWEGESISTFTSHPLIEAVKDSVRSVVQHSPATSRGADCRREDDNPLAMIRFVKYEKDACNVYRYVVKQKHRTHLFFAGDVAHLDNPNIKTDPHDITLVVQTTLDRFSVLERVLERWKGPYVVTFYVTDFEAEVLPEIIAASKPLKKRRRPVYHVVYKRDHYPINYIRNVGLSHVSTPYLITIDVDLVPDAEIYWSLRNALSMRTKREIEKEVLVVPAFEAFIDPCDQLAKNKTELLAAMNRSEIAGYSMRRMWNLGHRSTNYAQWMSTNISYTIVYRDAYEPYVVVPTNLTALYNEDLVERMRDKIAYSTLLHGMGYTFRILPNNFVVHIPHERQNDRVRITKEPDIPDCRAIFYKNYVQQLKKEFPDRRF